MTALAKLKIQTWPYAGPIAIKETYGLRDEVHIVDSWCYLGTAKNDPEITAILEQAPAARFDLDTYKILRKQLMHSEVMNLNPNI